MRAIVLSLALLVALAACGAPPEPILPTVPGIDPLTGQPFDLTPGLNDKEPDTCHGAEQAFLIGQPASAVATQGVTRPIRIVPLGEIVDQEEYNSSRINFMLDATGIIVQIKCG